MIKVSTVKFVSLYDVISFLTEDDQNMVVENLCSSFSYGDCPFTIITDEQFLEHGFANMSSTDEKTAKGIIKKAKVSHVALKG